MSNPGVESTRVSFGRLGCGFFRRSCNPDQIYFAMEHGKWTFHFPVKDGKVCRTGDGSNIYPNEEVEIIPVDQHVQYGIPAGFFENPNSPAFWQ